MSATVYVTQVPTRRDSDTRAFVPSVNIGPAIRFGNLKVMLPGSSQFADGESVADHLRPILADYNFDAGDSLLALGDPTIIAVASAILGRLHGRFTLLKWDRLARAYIPVNVNV
jgi:hypothetical protein